MKVLKKHVIKSCIIKKLLISEYDKTFILSYGAGN